MARPKSPKSMPLRGRLALNLIKDLAAGEIMIKDLAIKYERSHDTIQRFRDSHREEIQALIDSHGDSLRALWIAEKDARVAEYQSDVDRVNQIMDEYDRLNGALETPPALLRAKQEALRRAAEELGAIRQHTDSTVTYRLTLDGVDQADLQ